jgi:hypothetical protein
MKALKFIWFAVKWWLAVPIALFIAFPKLLTSIDHVDEKYFSGAGWIVYVLFLIGLRTLVSEARDVWKGEA